MQILIIEDEVRLAKTIQKGLQAEHFMVDIACTGKDAKRFLVNQYDLIVLDLMLPEVGGLEILSYIREKKGSTPVIILTARDSTESKVKGLDLGADDYLTKPFDFEELIARIHALIRRSTKSDVVLTVDTLELNPRTKIVIRGGKHINLSSTEYRLLEYMMHHRDSVLSESDILEHVWDHSYEGMSNVVSVYIRYLRNKIDKPFPGEQSLIHTVRGLGYALSESR